MKLFLPLIFVLILLASCKPYEPTRDVLYPATAPGAMPPAGDESNPIETATIRGEISLPDELQENQTLDSQNTS